ncbi:hypothetical protein SFRURICE_012934 [Spodoptera frugiperda]|nr:hypothetical protein SFRURICE_012934 [Spodoptera frugiperda]
MTFTLGLNMRFISSLCFGEEFQCSANFLCINAKKKTKKALDSGHRACHIVGPPCQYNAWEPRYPTIAPQHWISRAVQLHGMLNDQNLTTVDFYMKSLVYTEGIGRVS